MSASQLPLFLVGQIFVWQNTMTFWSLRQEHSSAGGNRVSMLQSQPSGTHFHHSSTHDPLVVDSLELGWKPISSHRPMDTSENLCWRAYYFLFYIYITHSVTHIQYQHLAKNSGLIREYIYVNATSHSRWPCFSSGHCMGLECIAFISQNIVDVLGVSSPAENIAIQGILWRLDMIAISICCTVLTANFDNVLYSAPAAVFVIVSL